MTIKIFLNYDYNFYFNSFIIFVLGQGLQKASNDIKTELQKVSKEIGSNTYKYTNLADNYRAEYGPYRFYVGIAVCSILLLVSLY